MPTTEPKPPNGVSLKRIRRDIELLATVGGATSGAMNRTSFSAEDRQARQWLEKTCAEAGLPLRTDGIGNVFVRVDAPEAPAGAAPVWTGSHLDTVPEGGRFDGILGSVAALEVARCLTEQRIRLARPVDVVIFADEEGCYHHLLGSTALVSNYPMDTLTELRGRDGDLLVDALEQQGWDYRLAAQTAVEAGSMHAFVELHIEQGPVLESTGTDIGVVTSIVGIGGGQLEFSGSQDHAGTTPMPMRCDALQGAGEFLAQLSATAQQVSGTAVLTCGIMDVHPGGSNVVPGRVRLQLDFRDQDRASLLELESSIVSAAERAARNHGLTVSYSRDSITAPVPLDAGIQQIIEDAAQRQGLSTMGIPSGAGHDSQNMARLAPTGMIFIPSTGGRSHTPAEHSSWEDIEKGVNVLLETVTALASR